MHLLLGIIYLAFISLGLPDSLLGSAWPVLSVDLHLPLSSSGIIFMIISAGTVISSLNADRLLRKYSTGVLTAVSTGITAGALFGFSVSRSLTELCFWAVPYGLGAGCIDTALNNYVALHYETRHMNWLHCMWGIGASVGPYLMSLALVQNAGNWQGGYRTVGFIQLILTTVLFATLSLWKAEKEEKTGEKKEVLSLKKILFVPGVTEMMITFFCYCALEQTAGLWASSWLVHAKGVAEVPAAAYASFFFTGITLGRALCGFLSYKCNDKQMIRLGLLIVTTGLCGMLQNFSVTLNEAGLILLGFGCAPVYPSLIHTVPAKFGAAHSQAIIGMQMASAYIGTSFMPPLFGWLIRMLPISVFPYDLLLLTGLMILFHEKLQKR